ncbi:MAG: hypothetical protein HRU20_27935 [Pseudomonadales bacterium]|nr:hypothetical protein [Pseudomonadales bacterium]
MVGNVGINGIGMCSSFGGYHDTCAAMRANINRFRGHSDLVFGQQGDAEPSPITVSPLPQYLEGYQDKARLIKMLTVAYNDLLENNPSQSMAEDIDVFFALADPQMRCVPEDEDLEDAPDRQRLNQYLQELGNGFFRCINQPKFKLSGTFGDRVSFAKILQRAIQLINSGEKKECLLVVADSLLQTDYLENSLNDGKIKTDATPTGYVPGEGAVMFWLSNEPTQSKTFNVSLDQLQVVVGQEVLNDDAPPQGEELLNLLNSLATQTPLTESHIDVFSDLTGSETYAMEMATWQLKCKQFYPNMPFNHIRYPSTSLGEVGALMGAISLAWAMAAFNRDYATSKQVLIPLVESDSARALIYLRAA